MVQIRKAKKEDIEKIITIAKEVQKIIQQYRTPFRKKVREFNQPRVFYLKAIRAKNSIVLVAETIKGDIAGYVYANIEKTPDDLINVPYVSINTIAVKRRYQGFGIGRRLIEHIHKWTREKKIKVIRLSVWEFNKKALKFYKKMGYKTIMRKMEKTLK